MPAKRVIIVQHTRTCFYFQHKGRWTLRIEDAYPFPNLNEARECCQNYGSSALQIVIYNTSNRSRIVIPQREGVVDERLMATMSEMADGMVEMEALRERKQQLAAQIDSLVSEGKERRKRYPFKRRKAAGRSGP